MSAAFMNNLKVVREDGEEASTEDLETGKRCSEAEALWDSNPPRLPHEAIKTHYKLGGFLLALNSGCPLPAVPSEMIVAVLYGNLGRDLCFLKLI